MRYSLLSPAALMFWRAIEHYGCDPAAIFAAAGLDPDKLNDASKRYDVRKIDRAWTLAVEATGDPCFGLRMADFWHPTTLHALGYAWLASDTLGDALKRLVRYFRMISDYERLELEQTETELRLQVSTPDNDELRADRGFDGFFAVVIKMCRASYGTDLNPTSLYLRDHEPPDSTPYRKLFRVAVRFKANTDMIAFDREVASERLPTANAELAQANDEVVLRYLARFDRQNIPVQVKSWLVKHLSSGLVSQEVAARELHMSPRGLQRRLSEEGTSFKLLLDETRRELAMQYVSQSRLPLKEIAFLLGFSEQSNFARAFRRWTGCSPSAGRSALESGDTAGSLLDGD